MYRYITKVPPLGAIASQRCNNFQACCSRRGFPLSISVSSRTSRKCAGCRAFLKKGEAYSARSQASTFAIRFTWAGQASSLAERYGHVNERDREARFPKQTREHLNFKCEAPPGASKNHRGSSELLPWLRGPTICPIEACCLRPSAAPARRPPIVASSAGATVRSRHTQAATAERFVLEVRALTLRDFRSWARKGELLMSAGAGRFGQNLVWCYWSQGEINHQTQNSTAH
jgi:hypothetical protein